MARDSTDALVTAGDTVKYPRDTPIYSGTMALVLGVEAFNVIRVRAMLNGMEFRVNARDFTIQKAR